MFDLKRHSFTKKVKAYEFFISSILVALILKQKRASYVFSLLSLVACIVSILEAL